MPSRRRPRTRPRLWPLVLLGAAVVLVALALLALPFRHAPAQAEQARAELQAAKDALVAGDTEAADAAVQRARTAVDDLQGSVQGIGGDVWSWVPLAAGPVRDVRRLSGALDDVTAAAETGVELLPQVRGDDATLVSNGNVDLVTLNEVIDQLGHVSDDLTAARASLDEVPAQRMFVGTELGTASDAALEQIEPLLDRLASAQPLMDVMPRMFGETADRQYLVALLNPAELRYSGGTPLTFTTMNFDGGRLTMGEADDTSTARGVGQPIYWKKVKGNPFHRGRLKVLTATMAPDWRVSGNELANAWRSLRGRRLSGVVVIDVVALADLVELSGPLELPSLGTLDADNLVERLVGSYDQYPDPAQRKRVNRELAPVFSERLLSSSDPVQLGKVLAQAADERRFAVYLRSEEEQASFEEMGLTGTLGPADRDYLGVFTQNRVPSKTDYWQRRAVRSDVTVRKDGSAHVRLSVEVHNDSPPYVQPVPDPRAGYFTRYAGLSVLTMLPEGAEFSGGTIDGDPVTVRRGNFYDRTFQRQSLEFAPQAKHHLVVEYDVPSVADIDQDGAMTYGLVLDPQGMVEAQSVDVRVQFPRGFDVDDVPDGWEGTGGRVATYRTDALETSEAFEVVARP